MARYWIPTLIVLAVLGGVVFLVVRTSADDVPLPSPPAPQTKQDTKPAPAPQEMESPYKTIDTNTIEGIDPRYDFRAEVPKTWVAEAVAATQAINIYDPDAPGDSSLEQSQIFIRQFSANTFLTLQTVTIRRFDRRRDTQDGGICGRSVRCRKVDRSGTPCEKDG